MPEPRHSTLAAVALACLMAVGSAACTAAEPPPTRETVHLRGTPYERGLQHGKKLRSKIRSFITTMLDSSLLPYINRERPDIAAALKRYAGPKYDTGFSRKLMLESAEAMRAHVADHYIEEMQGVADGAGLLLDDILLLNTFVDSVMAVRGVALALRLSQAPMLVEVDFGDLSADKIDNDGDGTTDEKGEGRVDDYASMSHAAMTEVPVGNKLTWVLADIDGVDPATVRCQLDDRVFVAGDPAFSVKELAEKKGKQRLLQITFTPPAPLPAAATVTLMVMGGDRSVVEDPPPTHARFMRDERITFTTAGKGQKPWEAPNIGREDGRSQPAAVSFAVRGSATPAGNPLLAQHFSMLDANTSHKHTAVFVHHPESGPSFAYVGWAGLIWGFSGLNDRGLAATVQYSDTLKSSMVNGLIGNIANLATAPLLTTGEPIGLATRDVLSKHESAAEAAKALDGRQHTMGWNVMLVDAKGGMRSVEIDSDAGGAARSWAPDGDPAGLDEHGGRLASVGPDDLRMGVHFVKNTADMPSIPLPLPAFTVQIRPQSGWSSYYFRSLRTFGELGGMIRDAYGTIDVARAQQMLAHEALVETSDGMNAVVIEPAKLRLHSAMGTVPATDSPFVTLQLDAP